MRRLSLVVRAKGKIHAFYNLNCRWGLIPEVQEGGPEGAQDVDFFNDLFWELESDPTVRQRVCEIVESALGRLFAGDVGIGSEHQYGNHYGTEVV